MLVSGTLLDKLWDAHEILQRDDGTSLLWVDRHLVHEGSHHAFAKLQQRSMTVAEPLMTFGVADHYVPTRNRLQITDASITRMLKTLKDNANHHGIRLFGLDDPQQGIVHVIGPELGLTTPGLLINCGDSHTSTHGAFGALAFGIGATEVAHVLATQTLWQLKPQAMRISIEGELDPFVTAKDIALHWIAALGSDGARGYAVEYAGSTIKRLSMDARMTLCNLSIEGGARFGLIAPDDTTYNYVQGRPYAPSKDLWSQAVDDWRLLVSDNHAAFDKQVAFKASSISPTVSWGTSPEQSIGIGAAIPNPDSLADKKAIAARSALDYMGLAAGQAIEGTPIDQVFIGSCTNARLEDLRIAAKVINGYQSKVPGLVSPGSTQIKRQAEDEGLADIFIGAGLEWADSGCSSCVGMNGDIVGSGKRCASTTNRNFRGRQGKDSRTHLMSPAMAAAAAVHGKIVDVRDMRLRGTNH
ncbi:MAG: 3-isopropylmalate dehydratase large subunit [Granulosicoccus sp.]